MPFSKDKHVPYSSIKDKLNTGDIVLFSSVCSAGFAIKVIGVQQFTHAALVSIIYISHRIICIHCMQVLKPKGSDVLMVWESSRNFVGKI